MLLGLLGFGNPEEDSNSSAYKQDTGKNISEDLIDTCPPFLEGGSYGSDRLADIAFCIVFVIVLVVCGASGLTKVALLVAGVVILVRGGAGSLTEVALLIALVIILMGSGAGCLALVALGVAFVVVGVLAGLALGILSAFGVLICECGNAQHTAKEAKNKGECKKER